MKELAFENDLALVIGKQIPSGNEEPRAEDIPFLKKTMDLLEHIYTLHRDEVYNKDSEEKNMIDVSILKVDGEPATEQLKEYYNIR